MAISKIEKIQILAHNGVRQALVEKLQHLGLVEITSLTDTSDEEGDGPDLFVKTDKQTEEILSQLEFCLNFLGKYAVEEGALEKLKKGKPQIGFEELNKLVQSFKIGDCNGKCSSLEREFHAMTLEETHLESLRDQVEPWKEFIAPLGSLTDTPHVIVKPVRIPEEILGEFSEEIDLPLLTFKEVSSDTSFTYGILFAHREAGDELSRILSRFGLDTTDLASLKDTASEIIHRVGHELKNLADKRSDLENQSLKLTQHMKDLQILHDYYSNCKNQVLIQSNFQESRHTFFLEGWVRKRDTDKVKAALIGEFSQVDIQTMEPGPDEDPPIDLTNSDLAGPFEAVTSLYGLPNYHEKDPTPILAPFFFVFFGLCLADAGYGLIMMALFGHALYRFKLEGGMKKMAQLLFCSGVATLIAGIITGGFFGDIFTYIGFSPLIRLQKAFIVFDPIKQPLVFMILALVLGFIQISVGMGVKLVTAVQEKRYADAAFCEGAWLTVFLGFTFYGLAAAGVLAIPVTMSKTLIYFGAGVLFLFAGRGEFNPLKRLGLGLLEVYSIIAHFSDVLSYSRILALGLASAVVANVVNQIADMTTAIPVLGYVIMILILVGGHIFNLLVNALGAYVHTSRLQYVEFFPKFFEGGGRLFTPFSRVADYSVVKD